MHHRTTQGLARLMSAVVAFTLLSAALLASPAPRSYAADQSETLFHAEFGNAPLGPLTGPLSVEAGTVVPHGGSVAVVGTPIGRKLGLDGSGGQATALMQWTNYPGALPISSTQDLSLRITGDFTASISGTAGASFGLLSGANFFELFRFGAGGAITRNGAPLGLTYRPGLPIRLDARITLGSAAKARIALRGASGVKTIEVALPGAFSVATLNQLRFQAPAGSGVSTADHLMVRLLSEQEDDEPPSVIIIRDPDIEHEIERINGVIFISIKITIINTGGKARGVFLILDLDDLRDLVDLADVSFINGVGFVSSHDDHQLIIGLGQNNQLDANGKIMVKIKFKVKQDKGEIRFNPHFRLRFGDSDGDHEIALPVIVVIVPIVVVPVVVIQRLPLDAIDSRFVRMWREQGGLDIFGLPLTAPITQPDGIIVQYFERVRMEWHPELRGTRYAVLLGLLGVELGHSEPMTTTTVPTSGDDLQWYFPATNHLLAKPFRGFWQGRGGLALFGLPIGEAHLENGLLVQYFERARMELHPELAGTPYEVQLGHLGVQALEAAGAQP